MAYDITEAKEKVIEAGLRLNKENLIVRTWGNISARVSDTQFVITPSGRAYDTLTLDDIVLVDIKTCNYEGDIKPSSECGVHADVYAMRPEVNFVVHTHQLYASVVSILGKDVELAEEEQGFLGAKIPCAKYGMSSSDKLRKQVKKCLKDNPDCSSMLLRNHGVLCMGSDFEQSFEISSMMEQICKFNYEKLTLGFSSIGKDDSEEDNENWDDILVTNEDLKDGFVDYGSSVCNGNEITLTLGDKEYVYSKEDDKPLGKGLLKRSLNKVAKLHAAIYEDRNINCISQVTLNSIVDVSKKSSGFVPYIDDQAQIIGDYLKVVGKIGKKAHFESSGSIVKALRDSNAVLIAGQGALVTAHDNSDLEAAAFILEKGCMAARLAACSPEADTVPKRIAKEERKFYVESYSKLK